MDTLHTLFGTLYHFNELIRWGGYTVLVAIVFAETGLLAGFFLPGDSLLVTAGLLAAGDGPIKIWWLFVLLSAAAIAGDSTGYAIGYHVGPRVFNREGSRFFHKDHLIRTQRFYEQYGAKTIVLARFMPIIRTFAPTVAGVGKMRYRTFLLFNVAGGVGWVASMTLAGYFLGRSIPDIERHLHWVVGTVILLSVIPIAREWFLSRRSTVTPTPRVLPAKTAQGKETAEISLREISQSGTTAGPERHRPGSHPALQGGSMPLSLPQAGSSEARLVKIPRPEAGDFYP